MKEHPPKMLLFLNDNGSFYVFKPWDRIIVLYLDAVFPVFAPL